MKESSPRSPSHTVPRGAQPDGPAAPEDSAQKVGKKASTLTRHDVSELPEKLQELATQMLIDGAAVEDTFEAINERSKVKVTFQAVQNFYRSRVDLQAKRIEHQLKTAKTLKRALGNSRSGLNALADVIFMTGFMGMRRGVTFGAAQSMKERLERENLQLKKRLGTLKARETCQTLDYIRAQTRAQLAKARLVEGQKTQLQRLLKPVEKTGKLDPMAYQQIREIYGLLTQPDVPENAGIRVV